MRQRRFLNFIPIFVMTFFGGCGESVTDVDFRNQKNALNVPPVPAQEIDKISVSNLEISEITNTSFEVSLDSVGDQNGNAVVTVYFCNETLNPGCDPLTGGNSQVLDSGSNTFSTEVSPLNPPAYNKNDIINVTVITSDADGVNLGSSYSTQFNLILIKRIFRSVGFGNTTALANGAGNGFIITDGVATFTSQLPGNVGVGDAIQFDASNDSTIDSLVFITERLNNLEYEVRTNLGVKPADMTTADEDWEIFRAYNRLDRAESGTENTALDDTLEDFDTWSGGRDLVTNEEQWNIAIYADAIHAYNTYLDGWTTDENYHLKVFAPSEQSEVGVSQRHSGVWDDSKATITMAGNGETLYLNSPYTTVEGLQIESSTNLTTSTRIGIAVDLDTADESKIIGNLIRNGNTDSIARQGIRIGGPGTGNTLYIINNIIYGYDVACISLPSGVVGAIYAYNNTLINCATGISGTNNNVIAKNNIVQGADTAYGGGVDNVNSDFNLSSTMTASGGANDITSANVLFLDIANNDFRLSSFDSSAVGSATDLSADLNHSFSVDINNNPRGLNWDLGASQAFLSNQIDARISNLQISTTATSFNSVVTLEGDNNNNSIATLYYCNETDTPSCDPVSGTATAMVKVSGDYALNISGLVSPNDPGDILNIRVVLTDPDGTFGSPLDTQITLENTIRKIYRSVGPGNTNALAIGTGNDLQIFNGTASFTEALAENIGVGDVIQYDSDDDGAIDSIVFIHGRINNQSYSVRNVDGTVPANLLNVDNDWEIYRAYTSLENATDGLENTGLADAIEDFDTWSGARDLVANNEQWNITCYADALDTSSVGISGWNTSLDNKIHIYTPYHPSEVGVSQRHDGWWKSPIEAYTIAVTGAASTSVITINSSFVYIEGLQVNPLGTGIHANNGIHATNVQDYVSLSHNIIKADFPVDARIGDPIGISLTMNNTGEARVWNNIIIGFKNRELTGIGIYTGYEEVFLYNNTVSLTDRCYLNDNNTDTHYKNNIAAECNIGFDLQTAAGAGSTNNISSDGTAPGASSHTFQAIHFNMPEIYDFRLAGNSYTAKGTGVDLSLDPDLPISDDITSEPRGSAWDKGASIAPTAVFRSVGEGNIASLQNGAGNDLDIIINADGHTQANFAVSIADNIGVGDMIQYDPDNAGGVDSIAFISERLNSQNFIVKNFNGDNCTVTTVSSQSWDIFRAYSSFANANDGVENTGIDDALENFDTFTDGKDLIYPREQWNIALYADAQANGAINFTNWGTSSLYRLKIFAPHMPYEVGTSQRHQGIFDSTKASTLGRTIIGANVILDGMQMANLSDPTVFTTRALDLQDNSSQERTYILKNSIIRGTDLPGGDYLDSAIGIGNTTSQGTAKYYIYNNLFIDGAIGAYVPSVFDSDLYFYHNTLIGAQSTGISISGTLAAEIIIKNNISKAADEDYFWGSSVDDSSNNISFDNTSVDGAEFQNQNVGFLNFAREDFRISGSDSSALNRAVDLKNDPYLNITTDIIGVKRTQPDIGAFEAAKNIYRSMGVGNTASLATGAGNDLTIITGIATFSVSLPDNIGVGDVIQFDSDGDNSVDALVFISGRNSSTEFIVQTVSGDVPADMSSGDQDWSIFRAYISLTNAETGVENTGLDDTLENFDTWVGGKDLVANGENWNIVLYKDATETGSIVFDGWTTSSGNRINIFTPYLPEHVGTSQRHTGTAGTGFVLNASNAALNAFEILTDYTTLDGLEITKAAGADSEEAIRTSRTGVVIKNNIIHDIDGGFNNDAIHIQEDAISNAEIFIFNNLIYNISRGGILIQDSAMTGFRVYIYNNTIVNAKLANIDNWYGGVGFDIFGSYIDCIIYAKNNYVHTLDNVAYLDINPNGYFDPSSTNNASNDASAPGINPVLNIGFPLFEDLNNEIFKLAALDTSINGAGLNLSDDEHLIIAKDIIGNPKNFDGDPDIGAFEAPTKIYRSSGFNSVAALAVGAGNGLTIDNGIATFVNALPDNIGVGDVIELDTNNNGVVDRIAIIHGRIDSQNFKVRNPDGGMPNNSPLSDEDWSIFRAATGLNQAESGDENDSLNDGLEDFDTWSGGKDMVSAHEQWNLAVYGDAIDESNANAEGWVTSKIHRLKIYAPYLTTEVGTSQRHYGVWSPDAATLEENGGDVMAITDEHVTIDGLQFMSDSITSSDNSLDINLQGLGATDIEISNNIMRYPLGDVGTHSVLIRGDNLNQVVKVFNNIIYFESPGGGASHCINSESTFTYTGFIYHNTCYGSANTAIRNTSVTADVTIKNNIAQNTGGFSYSGTFNAASTNNLTDDGTSAGLNPIVSTTVSFNDLANFDFRLSPYDTTSHDVGADLSSDINLNVQNDIIGMTRGSAGGVDVGAHEGATAIFRSIEFGNTTALDTGASGNLDIASGVATFANALPDNIGVGDAIEYDVNNDGAIDGSDAIVFIHRRNSETSFNVRLADGTLPPDTVATDTDWSIYRAYTSAAEAMTGTGGTLGDENTSIDADLRNFDTHTTAVDMVATNTQWNFALYASSTVETQASYGMSNWNPYEMNYIRLFAPHESTEVGDSQRHKGKWDENYAMLRINSNGNCASGGHIKVDGIQFDYQNVGTCLNLSGTGSIISNNIIANTLGGNIGDAIYFNNSQYYNSKVYNNIISDVANRGIRWNVSNSANRRKLILYNNTVIMAAGATGNAFGGAFGGVICKNNLAQGDGTTDLYGANRCDGSGSDYNLSSDATANGANAVLNATVSFVDSANRNFFIANADVSAKDAGLDLSADLEFPLALDASGEPRGVWDIGALRDDPVVGYTAYNSEGSGTPADPFNIYNKAQILDIGNNGCNSGTTTACGDSFKLIESIDLTGETYTPIGDCTNAFTGTFDGSDKVISNLTINDYTMECVGLFGKTDGATLENIILENIDLQGDQYVGAFAGQLTNGSSLINSNATGLADTDDVDVGGAVGHINTGINTIDNVHTSVNIGTRTVRNTAGGFVGYCIDNASITNSSAGGDIIGFAEVGGFAGEITGNCSITNSTASGSVTGSGATGIAGGFIGNYSGTGTLSSISASGDVSGSLNVGGLIGEASAAGNISNCSARGNIIATDIRGAGLIAYVYGAATIDNCYALGDVRGSGTYDYAGLIAVLNNTSASITNSWAGGDIHGTETVAGLIGFNGGATVTDSFALGNVYATGYRVGGAFGRSFGGTISRCYAKGDVYNSYITDSDTGGFIGATESDVTISKSYATGNIYGEGNWIGGFVGRTADTSIVTQNYATGNVFGNNAVGGFVGYNQAGSVTESYATGNITGNNNTGGFVGFVDSTIENNFSTGQVFGNNGVGSFCGTISGGAVSYNYSLGNSSGVSNVNAFCGTHSGGAVNYNYWNSDNNSWPNATEGIAPITIDYTSLATSDMQLVSTFSGNWNYTTIWTQNNKYGLPHHKWSPEGICTDNHTVDAYDDLGLGTAADPYIICNKEQVQDMDSCSSCNSYFVLGADIDFQNTADLDGVISDGEALVFDGRGHRIFNYRNELLFRDYDLEAQIKNLAVLNIRKEIGAGSGDIFGGEDAKILNVDVFGYSNTADGYTSGFSYGSSGLFHSTNLYADINAGAGGIVGGFTGYTDNLIYKSSFVGDITADGIMGAFIARPRDPSLITKSFGSGLLLTNGNDLVQGFTGLIGANTSKSISSLDIQNNGDNNWGSYSFGGNVENSYAYGNINSPDVTNSGGLASLYAMNSYFQGTVVAEDNTSGIGTDDNGSSGNFWDTDVSGEDDCDGNGSLSTVGVCEGKTTAEMDDDATYTGAGWDTSNIWLLRNNVSAPLLRWNIHPVCYANATANTYNAIGSGNTFDPYLICFKEQLIDLAINGCSTLTSTLGCANNYQLMNDIDLKGEVITPIGYGTNFSGVFEGNSKRIFNLNIVGGANNFQGLFAAINGAEIYNLSLIKVDISSTGTQIGALAGDVLNSTIRNIIISGQVTGGSQTGGVFGETGTSTGINNLKNLVFYGDVSSVSGTQVGGLVGSMGGESYLENSYAGGSVSSGGNEIGGLAGTSHHAEYLNNSVSMDVTGVNSVAGIVGESYSYIANNSAYGSVTDSTGQIGGIGGQFYGMAVNNFTKLEVNSASVQHGGLIGNLSTGSYAGYNYAFGTLAGGATKGGIGGITGVANNNYYDSDESGDATQDRAGEIEPLTTTEIRDPSNLSGWDFTDTWKDINGEHPTHKSAFLQSYSSYRRPAAINEGEEYLDTTGLISLFHFDESPADESTNFVMADETTTPTDGTLVTGDTTTDKSTTGVVGGALDFDGVDDYVTLGNPVETQLTGAMSVMAWLYLDSVNNLYIVCKTGGGTNRGWNLSGNVSGANFNLEFRIASDNATYITSGVTDDLLVGRWYHVAGVYRPSTSVEIWVDGELKNIETIGVSATQYNSTRDVEIGAKTQEGSYLDGIIDEVSIWSRALSGYEINEIYTRQRIK